jgi:hypothetical protein
MDGSPCPVHQTTESVLLLLLGACVSGAHEVLISSHQTSIETIALHRAWISLGRS